MLRCLSNKYGADWHAADKAARLAEARTALSGTPQSSVAAHSTSGACSSSTSTKRPVPDAAEAKEPMTLGYWKIRGLASAARMMFYYKKTPFINKAYGEDAAAKWFGGHKPPLQAKTICMRLPAWISAFTKGSKLLVMRMRSGTRSPSLTALLKQ